MPFFQKSRKPSQQVKVIKAVNGGSRGHRQQREQQESCERKNGKKSRRTLDEFWGAIDEREFDKQRTDSSPTTTKSQRIRNKSKRQYSYDSSHRTKQPSSTSQTGDDADFWKQQPNEQEEEDGIALSPSPSMNASTNRTTGLLLVEEIPLTITARYDTKTKSGLKKRGIFGFFKQGTF